MHRSLRLGLALIAVVLACSGVHYAYSLYNPVARWPVADIPVGYYINPSNGDGLAHADVIQAVQTGSNVWNTVPNAGFGFTYLGQTSRTEAAFNGYNDVVFSGGFSFAIATTYTWVDSATNTIILESDQVFWDRNKFFTHAQGGCRRGYWVEGITAHERGHTAGIAHSAVQQATMYATTGYCDTSIETLHVDDEDALRELYPDGTIVDPPAAPTSLTSTVDSADPSAQVIDLAWTDNSTDPAEDRFIVERALDGVTFQYLGQTAADTTAYADASVQPDTTYFYRVFAESDDGGLSDPSNVVSADTVPIPNDPPTASAGGPYSGAENSIITFDGSGSSDLDGDPLSYDWDFGDGTTMLDAGSQPSHTYTWGGSFTVQVTVSDGKGGSDTASTTATVTEVNDVPIADAGDAVNGTEGQPVTFDASGSSDYDNADGTNDNDQTLTFSWDFGDGNTGSGQTPSHTYASAGSYTVTVTVSDGSDSDMASTTATIQAQAAITLSANGYKVRGFHTVDLSWSGATSGNVAVYRDGSLITTTANDGAYTDSMNNRGGGSYTYQVCEAGASTCSNTVTVTF